MTYFVLYAFTFSFWAESPYIAQAECSSLVVFQPQPLSVSYSKCATCVVFAYLLISKFFNSRIEMSWKIIAVLLFDRVKGVPGGVDALLNEASFISEIN